MQNLSRAIAVPLLAVLTVVASCDGGGGEANGTSDDPGVRLLEAGAAPRATLVREVAPGSAGSLPVTVEMTMGVVFDGTDIPPEEIPPIRTDLDLLVAEGREDGAYAVRFTIEKVAIAGEGSDPERLAWIEGELTVQNPVGLFGTTTRSRAGHVRSVEFEIPNGARPTLRHFFGNLRQAMFELAVPLPETEVGVGARWSSSRDVPFVGLNVTEGAEYRLLAVTGDRVRVALDAVLLAQPQAFELPNMPPGARCELVSLDAGARGELTLLPGQPLPVAADLRYVFDMRIRVQSDLRSPPQDANAHVELRIRAGE